MSHVSAYSIFTKENFGLVKQENPGVPFAELAKLVGARWRRLTDNQKYDYRNKARSFGTGSNMPKISTLSIAVVQDPDSEEELPPLEIKSSGLRVSVPEDSSEEEEKVTPMPRVKIPSKNGPFVRSQAPVPSIPTPVVLDEELSGDFDCDCGDE